MIRQRLSRMIAVTALGAPLLLGACASQEAAIRQAQDTANAAKAEADQANATAQQALAAAQAADQKADKADADAQAASQKADMMFQKSLHK